MSTTYPPVLPRGLVEQVFASDRATGGRPALPPHGREEASTWLRRALVEFDALEEHVGLLQALYGANFRLPRPRRDRWGADEPGGAAEPSPFRHAAPLPDDRVAAVANEGVGALSDAEMAALLLNPYALYDLFDVIDELFPEAWHGPMLEAGRALMERTSPPISGTKPVAEGTKREREPELLSLPAQRVPRWVPVGAAAAALLLAALGLGLIIQQGRLGERSAENRLLAEDVRGLRQENEQLRDAVKRLEAAKSASPLQMVSDRLARPADWDLLLENHYNPNLPPAERLARLARVLDQAHADEIAKMKAEGLAPEQVLEKLFKVYGPPRKP